jgi:hypothetical protein
MKSRLFGHLAYFSSHVWVATSRSILWSQTSYCLVEVVTLPCTLTFLVLVSLLGWHCECSVILRDPQETCEVQRLALTCGIRLLWL